MIRKRNVLCRKRIRLIDHMRCDFACGEEPCFVLRVRVRLGVEARNKLGEIPRHLKDRNPMGPPLLELLEHRLGKARALVAVRKDGEDATIRARCHEIPRDGFLGLDAAFQRDHAKRGCVLRELVAR